LNWKGTLWQPRSYDHAIRKEANFIEIVNYILENPVRKGLVTNASDWRWSGIIDAWD